ncbi:MAG: MFS transporter [Cyanobacteria bacterium J06641_5]
MNAPRSPWQLLNICFGSFGIQFGWALQTANVSAIYEFLGATPDMLPLLWLAGPISCLLVQPTIGYLSDRTWIPGLGRRQPYFLGGAILCSLALVAMPNASALWMAAGTLWVLDASIHVTMEPYRAFIADLVPPGQRARGFALQSFLVGLGAIVAASLPWWVAQLWPQALQASPAATIPPNVKISFYLGAAVFLGSILITVLTTDEAPPSDRRPMGVGWRDAWQEIVAAWRQLPPIGWRLLWVQLLSWMGIYCIFLFFAPAMGHQIFGAASEQSPQYAAGIAWAGVAIAVYNLACMVTSLLLPRLVRGLGAPRAHALCLALGGLGIIALSVVRDRYWLLLPLSGFGIAWASVLTIPYTLLVAAVPLESLGLFMGIFNSFIALPQLLISVGMGWVLRNFLGNNHLWATILGGGFLLLGAIAAMNLLAIEPTIVTHTESNELAGRT